MPTEVKEYKCDYCGVKGFFSEEKAREHESTCIKNPVVSEDWELCSHCHGTGNHYGKQRKGIIGYATCYSCGGLGRRKRFKITDEMREAVRKEMEKAGISKKEE